MFTGDMIESALNEHGKRLREEELEDYLTNNMFDETKLYVAAPGGQRAKKRRTLAHTCDITYKKAWCPL